MNRIKPDKKVKPVETLTFQEFLEELKKIVIGAPVGMKIEPDEDIPPVAFYCRHSQITVVPIPGDMMRNAATKDMLAAILAKMVVRFDARYCSFICATWYLDHTALGGFPTKEEMEKIQREGISEHPQRREAVMISAYSAAEYKVLIAPILRHPSRPPEISTHWIDFAALHPGVECDSRFVTPIMNALAKRN